MKFLVTPLVLVLGTRGLLVVNIVTQAGRVRCVGRMINGARDLVCVLVCVRVTIRAPEEKRLELSTSNLVHNTYSPWQP